MPLCNDNDKLRLAMSEDVKEQKEETATKKTVDGDVDKQRMVGCLLEPMPAYNQQQCFCKHNGLCVKFLCCDMTFGQWNAVRGHFKEWHPHENPTFRCSYSLWHHLEFHLGTEMPPGGSVRHHCDDPEPTQPFAPPPAVKTEAMRKWLGHLQEIEYTQGRIRAIRRIRDMILAQERAYPANSSESLLAEYGAWSKKALADPRRQLSPHFCQEWVSKIEVAARDGARRSGPLMLLKLETALKLVFVAMPLTFLYLVFLTACFQPILHAINKHALGCRNADINAWIGSEQTLVTDGMQEITTCCLVRPSTVFGSPLFVPSVYAIAAILCVAGTWRVKRRRRRAFDAGVIPDGDDFSVWDFEWVRMPEF